MLDKTRAKPRILVVTPEITYLPEGMGNMAQRMSAKAGGMADVSASLVKALHDQGADVHVALPNYRRMFHLDVSNVHDLEFEKVSRALPDPHIHLAEDRIFYHQSSVYSPTENHHIALAFQREVINHIIPQVRPDLIHCNDWMTGLIPPVARRHGIQSLFTLHNIHTEYLTLEHIEDRGIDAADFWQHLYLERPPYNYEESRSSNRCDLLTSGIFAASHVNAVSPTFLHEVIEGHHQFVPGHIHHQLWEKQNAGCASGILNAPDPSFNPASDPHLDISFTPETHQEGKARAKQRLQEELGLNKNPNAPLLFWPSRLDPVQKGPQLLAHILYQLTADYHDLDLQVAIIASGPFQQPFHDIVNQHGIQANVAVRDFTEPLSRLGYAASDFMIMPSRFEPCGLPQMASPKYGSIPIVHDTGGIHDTVPPLDLGNNTGFGFVFQHHTPEGLRWAIDEAMHFHRLPADTQAAHRQRIMVESAERFNHPTTATAYIELYEKILQRPMAS